LRLHEWRRQVDPAKSGPQRWESTVQLLTQLPLELRSKIGTENALRIYNAKAD